MLIDEKSRTHSTILRRALNAQYLGQRTKIPFANDPARSNYLHGRRRRLESGYCARASNFPSNRSTLASAISFASSGRTRKRCPASWPVPEDHTAQNQCCRRSDSSYSSCRCDSLEYADNGQSPRIERGYYSSYMAQAQFEAASCRNFQAQPGQAIYREAARYRRPLFKSSGQSNRFLCRREKPNSSIRTHPPVNIFTSGNSCPSNTRLYTARNYNIICRFKYARWTSYRRLYASPSASRIYSFFATHQCQDSTGSGLAPYRRQLWNTQAPMRSKMAKTPSAVPSTFYSDIQFMAEYGGTLVRRNYEKTHTSRLF